MPHYISNSIGPTKKTSSPSQKRDSFWPEKIGVPAKTGKMPLKAGFPPKAVPAKNSSCLSCVAFGGVKVGAVGANSSSCFFLEGQHASMYERV